MRGARRARRCVLCRPGKENALSSDFWRTTTLFMVNARYLSPAPIQRFQERETLCAREFMMRYQSTARHVRAALPWLLAVWVMADQAAAQTWANATTTPELSELITVDATGETNWLYGSEDVAGDGIDNFRQPEQSIDIRSAYAATDTARFWARVYVSDSATPGGNVTAYVFIDADNDAGTGGSAASPEIDARFTTDSTAGGYEYVLGVQGNGSIAGVWEWNDAQSQYDSVAVPPLDAGAEVGTDVDPILVGEAEHGYLQAAVDLDVVGLTSACDANLFVRSVNSTGMLGDGDLEVGMRVSCVARDTNGNGIPEVAEPTARCQSDAEWPASGICLDGQCVSPTLCQDDQDCDSSEICDDGQCVVRGGGMCTTNADCGRLVCSGGQCAACTGDAMCADGQRCAPSGECISDAGGNSAEQGYDVGSDEVVQGGACTCRLPGGQTGDRSIGCVGLIALAALWRRTAPQRQQTRTRVHR